MLSYFGLEFLREIQDYYGQRLSMALERGYAVPESKYHWLYSELDIRFKTLRQTSLFLDALPRFMADAEPEQLFGYVTGYGSRLFAPESVGEDQRVEGQPHPFYNNGNPYWVDLQESMDNFGIGYDTRILPLTYVDLCEYVIRSVRLYLQIREQRFRAIDRGKFDGLMHRKVGLSPSA